MMPNISNTQLFTPTQPTLVATSLPGTNAVRPSYDAVAPSVSNPSVSNNSKGTGGYAGNASAPAPIAAAVPLLSTPIPASFSTSSASLNASAIFTTQSLAQDSGSAETIFATYDQLVAASLVKYAPSNAALPQPDAVNLFAKLLNEQKSSNAPVATAAVQQVAKEVLTSVPQAALQQTTPLSKTITPKEAPRSSSLARSEITLAASAYRATSTRNQVELSDDKVDAISG